MSDTPPRRVTIALCTYNGAQHLEAQLTSYTAQAHADWDLWVSDDGSTDATLQILNSFAEAHGTGREIRIIQGPRAGVAANFLSLLCHPNFPKQPAALSDQDDVWLPEKLGLGMAQMNGRAPCLYGAQSIHTDVALRPIGKSIGSSTPSFGNALVQNIISGHSLMLNTPALALVRAAGVPQGVPYHDWWLYQLITGAGGDVVVRPEAVLLYRQHGANAMGSHQGLRALLTRAAQVFGRTYGGWIAANTDALRAIDSMLSRPTQATLRALDTPQSKVARVRFFVSHGLVRQGRLSTALLLLAVALGKI